MAQLWSWFVSAPDYYNHSPLFPNPIICLRDMAKMGVSEGYSRLPLNGPRVWLQETADWLRVTVYLDWSVLLLPFAVAIALTALRVVLNHLLFTRIPVWAKLPQDEADKLPESIWKCGVYTVTWSWAAYLVLFGEKNLFTDLVAHWDSWHPGAPVNPVLYWLYIFELGFYLHCIYATIYIETIRKDFTVLMLHHFLTIGLLLFSYAVRFHLVGLLLLFILDIGDIWLELSKSLIYFKVRDGKQYWGPELAANCTFAVFTIQHIFFRLYWFATKVIYSAMYVSMLYFPWGPYWLLFMAMLWALYAMQVYWFTFIVRLVVKIFRREELEDNRDYDDKDKKIGQNGHGANQQETDDAPQNPETAPGPDIDRRREVGVHGRQGIESETRRKALHEEAEDDGYKTEVLNRWISMISEGYFYLYGIEFPFQYDQDEPSRIVTVGITYGKGCISKRLTAIGKHFDDLTDQADYKLNLPTCGSTSEEEDQLISKAKDHPRILFIARISTTSAAEARCIENGARHVVGAPLINFVHTFSSQISGEKAREDFLKNCGTTEWVVSRHGDVKGIQEAFRSGSLDGDDMEQKQWSSGDKFIGALEKAKQSIVVMHDALHQESLILQQSIAAGKNYFVMSSKGGRRSQYDFMYLETKLVHKPLAAT